jgi:hypothetical protein
VNIATVSVDVAAATTRPELQWVVSQGQFELSWPVAETGWSLQAQTNSPNQGLGTNWVTIPNSNATNQMALPICPTCRSVFFRLVYP